MAENQTSPSLEDLLGGIDIPENSANTKTQNPEISSPSSENTPSITSLDDLLGNSDTETQTTEISENIPETGRVSRKKQISLDDLLGASEQSSSTSIHILDAHPESSEAQNTSAKPTNNIFHKGFENNAVNTSELLENIENYKEEGLTIGTAGQEREEDPFILLKEKEGRSFEAKNKKLRKFLVLAQVSIIVGIFSLVISFLFFSYLLDTPTKGLLGGFIEKNYGIELEEKIEKIAAMQKEERTLKKDIKKSKKIIEGFKNNSVLEAIIENRINWVQIIDEINQVRCEANPLSDISECKEDLRQGRAIINPFSFENYTTKGGMKNNQIDVVISGKASGSQGYIFQKISRLIQTFNDSKYFSGASMRQYSKTQDSRIGFYMPFTMKLIYHKDGKISEEDKKK